MIKKYYEEAKNGIDRRLNLSNLRKEVKDFVKMDQLYELVCDEMEVLCSFLKDEDPKTRKNAALLMGELDMSDFLVPLMEAYKAEKTLFIRASYLQAIKGYDYDDYLEELVSISEGLKKEEITEENKKHIEEELKLLSQLICEKTGYTKHTFSGFQTPQDVILVTNKLHKNVVEEEIKELPIDVTFKEFTGGVRLSVKDVKALYHIRSFQAMLFLVKGLSAVAFDPIEAAEAVAKSSLLSMLKACHKEPAPFLFRCEIKSKLKLDQKTAFAKKFSNELQMLSKHELINDPSKYEFELRIIENKSGNCNILLKMNTVKDTRFRYQVEPVATSLKPANAALLVSLAKPYMVADAQVLDPYVSGGEMLIERQMQVKANTSYGLDTREDAIEAAKRHAFESDQIIHFIKKDFAGFTHGYLFDEIFTQMPFAIGYKTEEMVRQEYEAFWKHVSYVMKPEGTLILYTRNLELMKHYAKTSPYGLIKEIPIGHKEQTYLCIYKRDNTK